MTQYSRNVSQDEMTTPLPQGKTLNCAYCGEPLRVGDTKVILNDTSSLFGQWVHSLCSFFVRDEDQLNQEKLLNVSAQKEGSIIKKKDTVIFVHESYRETVIRSSQAKRKQIVLCAVYTDTNHPIPVLYRIEYLTKRNGKDVYNHYVAYILSEAKERYFEI